MPKESLVEKRVNYCDGSTVGHLDVRITNLCDNACTFCIAAEGMKISRKFDLEAMIKSTKQVSPNSISIIGGEPMLFLKNLLDYMKRVEAEVPTVKAFYITTALPFTLVRQPELFREVIDHTEVLNVSLHHFSEDVNNLVLRAKRPFNRIAELAKLLQEPGMHDKIRVHLNLARDGIETARDLNAALYTLKEMGVKEVKVNELMNAPDDYVSFEEITGIKLPNPYSGGCSTSLDYFPDMKINLKRSCFVVEPSRNANTLDLLKLYVKQDRRHELEATQRVLYEDGELTTHWVDGEGR